MVEINKLVVQFNNDNEHNNKNVRLGREGFVVVKPIRECNSESRLILPCLEAGVVQYKTVVPKAQGFYI